MRTQVTAPPPQLTPDDRRWHERRRRIRRFAAGTSAIIAVLYGLIASHVVVVIDGPASEVARDQLAFAAPAATVYLVLALLLLRSERRVLWLGGAVLQVLVIAMYVQVAAERTPAYEVWGVTIRVLQIVLLAALASLAIGRTRPSRGPEPAR